MGALKNLRDGGFGIDWERRWWWKERERGGGGGGDRDPRAANNTWPCPACWRGPMTHGGAYRVWLLGHRQAGQGRHCYSSWDFANCKSPPLPPTFTISSQVPSIYCINMRSGVALTPQKPLRKHHTCTNTRRQLLEGFAGPPPCPVLWFPFFYYYYYYYYYYYFLWGVGA